MAELIPVDAQALLRQLAEGRERLRAERVAAKPQLEEARRLQHEAAETRRRARKSAARYLQRHRRKAADAVAPLHAAREDVTRQREDLRRELDALAAERERFRAEMDDARTALAAAWELHASQRERFADEERARDAELSRMFQLLESRERDARHAADQLQSDRRTADAELSAVRTEIAGLDKRAANARLQLQELEQTRAKAVADRVAAVPYDAVALAAGDRPAMAMTALEHRESEAMREHRELDARRRELDLLAEHLSDGRRILADQIEQVANARTAWQTAESRTVDELEELARAVEFRESMLAARDEAAARRDESRRERERELWKYQSSLDRWHELLVERETRFLAEREQSEVGLAARRGLLADREAGLDLACQKWEADHQRVRDDFLDAIARCRDESEACRAVAVECERERARTQDLAAKLAAWLIAAEQQYAETAAQPDHAQSARRVDVLRKRWEARFARSLRQLDGRLAKLHAETTALTARQAEWHRLAADATERQRQLALAERRRDRDAALANPLPPDQPIVLAVADDLRRRSDAEIEKSRRGAALAADALLDADAREDIVPLRPADAA